MSVYIPPKLLGEERYEMELCLQGNIPKAQTRRDEHKYLLWQENEELRELMGRDINDYQKFTINREGELLQ